MPAALYLVALACMVALVLAANRQQVITKDEASTAFVYPSSWNSDFSITFSRRIFTRTRSFPG
jgi:hypothetical protein